MIVKRENLESYHGNLRVNGPKTRADRDKMQQGLDEFITLNPIRILLGTSFAGRYSLGKYFIIHKFRLENNSFIKFPFRVTWLLLKERDPA